MKKENDLEYTCPDCGTVYSTYDMQGKHGAILHLAGHVPGSLQCELQAAKSALKQVIKLLGEVLSKASPFDEVGLVLLKCRYCGAKADMFTVEEKDVFPHKDDCPYVQASKLIERERDEAGI
jgi:DNA-directed RNA polymerase subunit RPC12/RpoP